MRYVLGLSIFYFFISFMLSGSHLVWAKPSLKASPKKKDTLGPNLDFLGQAEDIEREAWWIVTKKRIDGNASPFRVFKIAVQPQKGQNKSQLSFKICKSFLVVKQSLNTSIQAWRIESSCQKPTTELGVVEKVASLPLEKWKIRWKTGSFSEHFGLSTAILYNQQSCEITLDKKRHIERMSCPQYVRDRKTNEIVEFKIFEYTAGAPKILKIEGEVKKDLHAIASFKTEVPLAGDIVLKVKKIPQKAVEEKTEFSNIEKPALPPPAAGEPPDVSSQKQPKVKKTDDQNQQDRQAYEEGQSEEYIHQNSGDEQHAKRKRPSLIPQEREAPESQTENQEEGYGREIYNGEGGPSYEQPQVETPQEENQNGQEPNPDENSTEKPVPPIAPSR